MYKDDLCVTVEWKKLETTSMFSQLWHCCSMEHSAGVGGGGRKRKMHMYLNVVN